MQKCTVLYSCLGADTGASTVQTSRLALDTCVLCVSAICRDFWCTAFDRPQNLQNESETRQAANCGFTCFVRAEVGFMFTCAWNKLHCHLLAMSRKWQPGALDDKFTQQPTKSQRKTTGERGCVALTLRGLSSKAPHAHFTKSHTQRPFFFFCSFPWTNNRCNITVIYSLFSNFLEY